MLTGNAICHRNPNWWIWCITTKNDPNEVVLKRAHASTWHARARKFWYLLSNQLYYRDKRVRWPQFCRLVKGCQNWYATSSGQPGDQSSVFYLIDIDWRWDQKLLLYFRPPAGGGGSILPATNDSMRKIGDALLDSLH